MIMAMTVTRFTGHITGHRSQVIADKGAPVDGIPLPAPRGESRGSQMQTGWISELCAAVTATVNVHLEPGAFQCPRKGMKGNNNYRTDQFRHTPGS